MVYNFRGSAADIIHPSNPLHLVICFEFFCHTLTLCHLFYETKKHILSLFVEGRKIAVQFAACQQICVKYLAVLLDIS